MLKLNAETYSVNNNSLQIADASYVLDNYLKFMNSSKNDNILDVGTGDGTVLNDDILPRLHQNFAKIVALDINDDMLRIARTKFKSNPKIDFFCMDIGAPVIPRRLKENFDHIFSFYCLHWVPDQKQAFHNLFSMLKPGADMLLTMVVKHVVYEVHEKMALVDEWVPFTYDVKKHISPYYYFINPVKRMETLLEDVGFVDYKCELIDRQFVHENLPTFWEWSLAINPFIHRIPTQNLNLYKKDFQDKLMNSKYVRFENDGEGKVYDSYQMFTVFARKPEKFL